MPDPHQSRSRRVQQASKVTQNPTPGKQAPPIWRSKWAKKVFALVCLVVAGVVDGKLVNLPVGEVSGQFPVTVRARDEILILTGPGSVTGGPFSFMSAPTTEAERVVLDAFFDEGQLSDQTLQAFKLLGLSAPPSPGVITYLTSDAASTACATKLKVEPAGGNLTSVEFSQSGSDISSGYRSFGSSFSGTGAVVTLTSQGALQNGLSPCRIELSIGDWKQRTQGFLPIRILVPPKAHFRFHWQNLDERSSTWRTKSSALPLLEFGSSASDEFTTQTIAISSLNPKTGVPEPPGFEARGAKQSPLTVLSFGINQHQLEINASGKGRVLKSGKDVSTVNVLETLNKNPILSALFTAGNGALVGWVILVFFPRRRKRKSEA